MDCFYSIRPVYSDSDGSDVCVCVCVCRSEVKVIGLIKKLLGLRAGKSFSQWAAPDVL
jgi:hypothetical protein